MILVASTADIDNKAALGEGGSVWHLAHVREGAVLGANCVAGRGASVGTGVWIGGTVKIQDDALVHEPAEAADGAFSGPAAASTNDHFPRAVHPDGTAKSAADWTAVGVAVLEGASIGARAVCVAPVTIGRWALVAAGSTVIKDVPDSALVAGVPARRIGWVGRSGVPSRHTAGDRWVCPQTGAEYQQAGPDTLEETP